jgi:hypothetical protein
MLRNNKNLWNMMRTQWELVGNTTKFKKTNTFSPSPKEK